MTIQTDPITFLPAIHVGATFAMIGLIWFVQIVHYPLMAKVGQDRFVAYEQAHTARTTWIVAPLMLVELITAIAIVPLAEKIGVNKPIAITGVALLAIAWISTFAVQVPAHKMLSRGFCPKTHARLVRTNWVRTISWTARGLVAVLILLQSSNNPPT